MANIGDEDDFEDFENIVKNDDAEDTMNIEDSNPTSSIEINNNDDELFRDLGVKKIRQAELEDEVIKKVIYDSFHV